MANKVLLKKSSVAAKVPLTTDLDYGELALNYADEKLYFKNSSNVIKSFSTSGGGGTSFFTMYTDGSLYTYIGTLRWYAPASLTINSINCNLVSAADQIIIIAVKINGTVSTYINIPANQTTYTFTGTITMNTGDYLTTDITQVGTVAYGSDLYLQFKYS